MTSGKELIRLESLQKVYRTKRVETHALNQISITVNTGEFVTVTGPSGCGKSTLLSVLGLLEDFSGGKYYLRGREVSELSRREAARQRNRTFGFVFQSFHLVPELRVLDNVALVLRFRGESKRHSRERAEQTLVSVGLEKRMWHYPAQLSGGQQQRVAIARALVGDPRIILADEPTGNLDTENGQKILELMESFMDGSRTMVMVTHDPAVANRASRVISLLDGRVGKDILTPSQLKHSFRQ